MEKKTTLHLNETQLKNILKETIKNTLNEYWGEEGNNPEENEIYNTLEEIRNKLNTYLDNAENSYPGDLQDNLDPSYLNAVQNFKRAFDQLVNCCPEDWEEY